MRVAAAVVMVWLALVLQVFAAEPGQLDAIQAHTRAEAGKLVLIDVRTEEEWRETGIGTSAVPISMLDRAFLQKLDAAVGGDKTKPIAMICASGVRSAMVARALANYGFSRVYDVSEGMDGSRAGPGWLARKLPVKQP
ncbi:MAG: rhodanese-like domain-containing protein [Tepidamorphaceae bacterium]